MRAVAIALTMASVLTVAGTTASPRAAGSARPTVLELFTSQGCSSCPPADALLVEFVRDRPDVLALAFHVTYWNNLGWHDPFSSEAATARQRRYAGALGNDSVYTPELVVDGRRDVVGSDRGAALGAISAARSQSLPAVPLTVRREARSAVIDVAAGRGAGTVWLVGYDEQHQTAIGRGENGGRTLTEANIVRSFEPAEQWNGTPLSVRRPLPAGERLAAFVQMPDGQIVAAGREAP